MLAEVISLKSALLLIIFVLIIFAIGFLIGYYLKGKA